VRARRLFWEKFHQQKGHIMAISQTIIEQYRQLKRETPDGVLLMQVGVFMQVLDADAKVLSHLAGLKLRMAGAVDDPVVIGGFPLTGLDTYVDRLVRAGHSVAIVMQGEQKHRRITEMIRIAQEDHHNGPL